MRRIALVLISLFCAASANAELITFEFTGTINTLREYSLSTDASHAVVSSSMIPGSVRVGDNFHGAFTIDANLPLSGAGSGSAWYNAPWQDNSRVAPSSIIFDKTGTSLSSASGAPNILVSHIVGSQDFLSIDPWWNGNTSFSFQFYAPGGTYLPDMSIPSDINLSKWYSADARFTTFDWNNNRALSMSGMLTSVTKVSAVPEPESYAMFLAGLALVAGVAARRKRLA